MKISGPNLLGEVTASGNFAPLTTNIYDLGHSNLKWKDIHVSGTVDGIDLQEFSASISTGVANATSASYATTSSYALNSSGGGGIEGITAGTEATTTYDATTDASRTTNGTEYFGWIGVETFGNFGNTFVVSVPNSSFSTLTNIACSITISGVTVTGTATSFSNNNAGLNDNTSQYVFRPLGNDIGSTPNAALRAVAKTTSVTTAGNFNQILWFTGDQIESITINNQTFTISNPAAPVTATAGFNVTGNTAVTGNLNVTGKISNAYSVAVITGNTNAESGYLYVLNGNLTLTLPSSPSTGDHIKVSNRSGVATCIVARNSEKIMGATTDLTLDKLNSGFEMIYSGTAQGWILIGVEGTT